MAIANRGAVRAKLIQKRRVMSRSSGLSSSMVTVRGSSAMPQIGQLPGSGAHDFRMHGAGVLGLARGERGRLGIERHATLGTGARPDLTHLRAHGTNVSSGVFCRHARLAPQPALIAAGMIGFEALMGAPSDTNPDVIVAGLVIDMGLGGADRIFSGFAWNFAMQPAQQKKYSFSLCSVLKRAVAGFTSIPQTGSFCLAGDDASFGVSAGWGWSIVWCFQSIANLGVLREQATASFARLGRARAPVPTRTPRSRLAEPKPC